jgi:hypothetical protein
VGGCSLRRAWAKVAARTAPCRPLAKLPLTTEASPNRCKRESSAHSRSICVQMSNPPLEPMTRLHRLVFSLVTAPSNSLSRALASSKAVRSHVRRTLPVSCGRQGKISRVPQKPALWAVSSPGLFGKPWFLALGFRRLDCPPLRAPARHAGRRTSGPPA